jgi:DNA-binding transcriptional LysR family regulator
VAGFEPNIAFVTRDVLAFRELVASGLAVTLTGRLLAGRLSGIATPAVRGDPARRAIYAIRPSTDSHPLTRDAAQRGIVKRKALPPLSAASTQMRPP